MKKIQSVSLFLILSFFFLQCGVSINKTINIDNGDIERGSPTTINGSIFVGSDCEVAGSCRTINGSIEVGRSSSVKDLQTVNGSVSVAENVDVRGSIAAVNGPVTCDSGVKVRKKVVSVNGNIELKKTEVGKDVQIYNGHISLSDGTVVYGDVIVKDSKGSSARKKPIRIEISGGSVVEGDVISKSDDREVELILSSGGRVLGEIVDIEVIEE